MDTKVSLQGIVSNFELILPPSATISYAKHPIELWYDMMDNSHHVYVGSVNQALLSMRLEGDSSSFLYPLPVEVFGSLESGPFPLVPSYLATSALPRPAQVQIIENFSSRLGRDAIEVAYHVGKVVDLALQDGRNKEKLFLPLFSHFWDKVALFFSINYGASFPSPVYDPTDISFPELTIKI